MAGRVDSEAVARYHVAVSLAASASCQLDTASDWTSEHMSIFEKAQDAWLFGGALAVWLVCIVIGLVWMRGPRE